MRLPWEAGGGANARLSVGTRSQRGPDQAASLTCVNLGPESKLHPL